MGLDWLNRDALGKHYDPSCDIRALRKYRRTWSDQNAEMVLDRLDAHLENLKTHCEEWRAAQVAALARCRELIADNEYLNDRIDKCHESINELGARLAERDKQLDRMGEAARVLIKGLTE